MIEIAVPIHPSESREKVLRAMATLADPELLSEEEGDSLITFKAHDLRALKPMKETLKKQMTRAAARSVMMKGMNDGRLQFKVHKQAAYAQRVSFVTEENESPLGPITVTVTGTTDELKSALEYLTAGAMSRQRAPKTKLKQPAKPSCQLSCHSKLFRHAGHQTLPFQNTSCARKVYPADPRVCPLSIQGDRDQLRYG